MHVFIDTNIFLNFFHFSKDELDALNDIFATHEHGSADVHLTQQVHDEFRRNRENSIKDALKRFGELKYSAQLPSFMKGYKEYEVIRKLCNDLQINSKSILEKVHSDISSKKLIADILIDSIFSNSDVIVTTIDIYNKASMRMAIGNPPGKNKSIGDAINWIILLQAVPDKENLHIISEDGDFYSKLHEEIVHPFLEDEWIEKKNSKLFVYRTISKFMEENYDGVAFSFDKNKEALIDNLKHSGAFVVTHGTISQLENYPYFSLKEVKRILSAANENNQFGGIITDYDISDFINRIAVPRLSELTNQEHRDLVNIVIEDQKERSNTDK